MAILLAIFLLYRVFSRQDPAVLWDTLSSVSLRTFPTAIFFTIGSFTAISSLEYLAVRHAGVPVSLPRITATAVAAIGVSHAIGLAALSGGAIRYRMYARAGRGILYVGRVLLFSGLSTALGFAGIGGVSLLIQATTLARVFGTDIDTIRGIGVVLLVAIAAYFVCCVVARSRPLIFGKRFQFRLPNARVAALQIIGANTNVLCIAGALYACLRGFSDVPYPMIATLYVSSEMAALIGHVPGGWGVLEYLATSTLGDGAVLAGIILYRAIYYLLPLCVGLAIFLIDEISSHGRQHDDRSANQPVTNAM